MRKKICIISVFLLFFVAIHAQLLLKETFIIHREKEVSYNFSILLREIEKKLSYSFNIIFIDEESIDMEHTYEANSNVEMWIVERENKVLIKVLYADKILNLKYELSNVKDEIKRLAVKILERIAFERLINDPNWEYLQLTFWEGVDEYPFFSNDANLIAFVSDRYEGNRNIWYMDLTKYFSFPLKMSNSSEYHPSISPNKRYVAFQTSAFGKWDVIVMDRFSLNVLFSTVKEKNSSFMPTFISDEKVLFSKEEDGFGKKWVDIYEYDLSTNSLKRLTDDRSTLKFRPTLWNGKILFYSLNPLTGKAEIEYLNEKGEIKKVFKKEFNAFDSWSNGGRYFIYSSMKDGYYRIFFSDGHKTEVLTEDLQDDCYYPVFNEMIGIALFSVYYKDGEPDIFAVRLPALDILQEE